MNDRCNTTQQESNEEDEIERYRDTWCHLTAGTGLKPIHASPKHPCTLIRRHMHHSNSNLHGELVC
jgi:hypothetical protein